MAVPVTSTNIDDIDDVVTRPGVGLYKARLLQATGEVSKKGNPMVVPIFVIVDGDFEGGEARMWLTCSKKRSPKNGKTYAFGVMETKRIFSLIGKPLPKGFQFPMVDMDDPSIDEDTKQAVADAAASLFAKRLNNVDIELAIIDDGESDKIDERTGEPYRKTRTAVRGLFKKAAPVAAAAVDQFADDDE